MFTLTSNIRVGDPLCKDTVVKPLVLLGIFLLVSILLTIPSAGKLRENVLANIKKDILSPSHNFLMTSFTVKHSAVKFHIYLRRNISKTISFLVGVLVVELR